MRRCDLLVTLLAVATASLAAAQPAARTRDRAMPQYRAGMERMRAEQWEKAAEAFQRAIDADPTFEMAYYALGRANMPQKKYLEAVAALSKCRGRYLAAAGQAFSSIQELQQHRRELITEIDEMLRQYQSAAPSVQTSEALRQLQERKRQIQESMQRGVPVSLDTAVPSYVSMALGSAYFRLGRLADAEREYKATLAADPKTGEAHSNLAVVYLQTRRYDEAHKAVKAAEKVGFKVNPMLKDDIAARGKAEAK